MPAPGAADGSIEVHSCHGRARQVEVLRDAILHRLAEDPTLEPRDVIVMCPDIEAFAPLIGATFGAEDEEELDDRLPDLRVRLADRSLRQTNPVLGVVARILDLAGQRLTATQVIDFANREPVRQRFRLDDDDIARFEDWVSESGIRWGLDAEHRAPFKLAALGAGTWRAGLDRLLVGVTMNEDERRLFGGVLPLDDVDSGAIELAGRLAEFVDRLQAAVDSLHGPQTVGAWAKALADAADALTATAPLEGWQRSELQRLLTDVVSEAAGHTAQLALPEIRALLAERLQGRPTRANFRTGHLTICTLVPMRSVPHRVVCLLGLDDGTFPRKAPRDGDDLLLDDPHVGDRDTRTEDRQLLLDALLAAQDRLIITYTGNDERTNIERPPAVPVGELLDVVGREVVVKHPLQPFDPRNFSAAPRSFDRVMLEGARSLVRARSEPRPFLLAPLPPRTPGPLALDDLVRFVQHPVRAFLRQRLGISVGDYSDELGDALPVELDALERWGVGERLLDALMRGTEGRTAIRAEIAAGKLPPGQLGLPVVREIWQGVGEIAGRAKAVIGEAEPTSVDVKVDLADRRLTGTVPGVRGSLLTLITYSKVNPRHRLGAWVRLLALCASGEAYDAVTIGRAAGSAHHAASVTVARVPALLREDALAQLAVLVDLYDRGMSEPLPLACRTSAAFAERRERARRVGVRSLPEGGPGRRARAGLRSARAVRVAAGAAAARGRALGPGRAHPLRPVRAAAVARAALPRGGDRRVSRAFDICGPLPTGITVLEASAGTGKTYTIAALAARYVAEGMPLERLLLVTFTRMATGELRDRVRERLVSAERELSSGTASDDVVRMLADGSPEVVEQRRARLVRALADFDAATIATTHGFCQEVLSGLGVAANLEPDATLVEDPGDLLSEVVDDLYVRKYMAGGDALITRGEAMQIAEEVVANPGAPIEPADRSGDGLPALRARLAASVRDELDRRKRALAIITYDDLLTRLRDELRQDPRSAARLRERYAVVLVDEFQDTDPIQWEILQRAFGTGATTLVLIGDPKQAIYAFRGADVYSYLSAAETAGERDTLAVNCRSDQGLIDAYDAMFGGAKLGHEGIVYRHVRAAPEHQASRLSGAPDGRRCGCGSWIAPTRRWRRRPRASRG